MREDGCRQDLWIDIAFGLGMILSVVPEFLIHTPSPDPLHFWLNAANTVMDGALFLTVFIFLKREIAKRREANEALSLANRQKTEFLQIASHDLRNPLNAILLLAGQLRSGSREEDKDSARQISAEAHDMMGMIEELIDAAALADGSLRLHSAPCDLARCVAEVVERNRPLAQAKSQEIRFQPPPSLPAVIDGARMKQAVDNLVSNAIKFSPVGKPISVAAFRRGGSARIEVTDNGPGLTEADKRALFQRYQRLTARPTAGEPSIGLGLFNARRLVERNGGTIGAESEGPGLGSCFWIELQLETPPFPESAVS